MTIHKWNEHCIEVQSFTRPKFLWLTIAFKVIIDQSIAYESPPKIQGFNSKKLFIFKSQNQELNFELITKMPLSPIISKYEINIENEKVLTGKVRASNWYMTYLVYIIAIILYVIFL
jgi:hypothetical protein